MSSRFAILVASSVLASVCVAGQPLVTPLPEIQPSVLLEGMPSFYQRNDEFDGGGKKYCGPTAASNALMWLADHGYPNLKPTAEDASRAQTEMIKRLASFMGTYREGTSVSSFTSGVKSYLQAAGYSSKPWVFSGNSCANKTQAPPDINLVKTMSAGNTVMWFSVGWYSFDESSQKYTRDHGHWVTLVGYGKNRVGEDDPNSFVIADPESPNEGKFITLTMLNDGKITDGRSKMDAKGYFDIAELKQSRENGQDKVCILETIEALTIE